MPATPNAALRASNLDLRTSTLRRCGTTGLSHSKGFRLIDRTIPPGEPAPGLDTTRPGELFERAIDAAPTGVLVVDRSGGITVVNRAFEEQFGYRREELLGHSVEQLIGGALRAIQDTAASHAAGGPRSRIRGGVPPLAVRRKNDLPVPVDVTLSPIDTEDGPRVIVWVVDLSERRRLEDEQRREVHERLAFERLISNLSASFVNLPADDVDRAIREAQGQISEALDFDRTLLFEWRDGDFVPTHKWSRIAGPQPGTPSSVRLQFPWTTALLLSGKIAAYSSPDEIPDPVERQSVGYYRTKSRISFPLFIGGVVAGAITFASRERQHQWPQALVSRLQLIAQVFANALARKRADTALQAAYEDLRQTHQAVMEQERLRVIGQMASGIAHDINNGLSPVSLYTESILEREPQLHQDTREHLRTIQRAIDDVGHTLDRLTDFTRTREPALTLSGVDLNALVEQVTTLTRARWKDMPLLRGTVIDMRTELAESLPTIAGIATELRDALTNLVINAVDALPNGGTLTVRTRVVTPENNGATPAPLVQVEVCDTGLGMNEDTRRRCLEPFFTTKGAHGSGLGLAMVYGAVQRHGARLDIENRVGIGTTVRITFVPQPNLSAPERPATDPRPHPPLRILVVDDDPVLITSLTHVLGRDGHAVATAQDGREGLQVFQRACREARPFDVVITDLSMPHVDGTALASVVKRESPATTIVLLTGWGRQMVDADTPPPNVDRVLGKPPRLHELRLALAQASHAIKR